MGNQVKVENSNEILRKDYENDMVEVWQKFTLTPKPDLHGKTLNCSYVQVTQSDSTMYEHLNLRSSNYQKDHTGKVLFESSDDVEILVHYLAAIRDGPTVIPADASGQSINIRWTQKLAFRIFYIFWKVSSLRPNRNQVRHGSSSRETRRL